jgi:NAD(P)-dependent dehydrogenase (short-subunit alcohol dehydrogenase family)
MSAGWAAADMPGQHGRTVLVTGANSGIGFHTALELARHGAVVLLACRDADRGRAACGAITRQVPAAAVELLSLDLADLDSVARLADKLAAAPAGWTCWSTMPGCWPCLPGGSRRRGSSCSSAPTI